jgi:hypothetical protein
MWVISEHKLRYETTSLKFKHLLEEVVSEEGVSYSLKRLRTRKVIDDRSELRII